MQWVRHSPQAAQRSRRRASVTMHSPPRRRTASRGVQVVRWPQVTQVIVSGPRRRPMRSMLGMGQDRSSRIARSTSAAEVSGR